MVSFTSLAVLSLAAVGSLAAPAVEKRTGLWHHRNECMSLGEARRVADNYGELIQAYSDDLAKAALSRDFTDYSEGVNTLINTCPQGAAAVTLPLLSPTFSNRKQFMVGQGQQPAINFEILDLEHNCNSVTIRWITTNTAPIPKPRPVVGIIVLKTEKAPVGHSEPWLVHTVFSEFDSGAWLQNLEQWGICSVAQESSPTIILPSGSAPAPTATVYASASASAPAAASSYAAVSSAAAASSYAAASSAAAPSSYAAASSAAAPNSYAASSAAPASYAPSATASAYTA